MAFLIGGANTESAAYEIDNSLKFYNSDSPYLSLSHGANGNSKIMTWSFWTKIGNLGINKYLFGHSSVDDACFINNSDQLRLYINNSSDGNMITDMLFRDPSAWYHIVIAMDTSQSTAANRVKFYVNGSAATLGTATYPDQNYDLTGLNTSTNNQYIGREKGGNYFDGYISEFHFIDGTQKAASDFGETNDNGVWVPKKYSGSYGTNGYFLEFKQTGTSADASGKGADTSGNTNHFDDNNMTAEDITTDTPTNNFCTMNPLVPTTDVTFSEGNLKMAFTNSGKGSCLSTIGMTNGKWYFENKAITVGGGTMVGIFGESVDIDAWPLYLDGIGVISPNGYKSVNGTETSYGDSYTDDDIVSVAVDLTNNKIYWAKNGAWMNSGDPTSGSTGTGALSLTADKTWFAGFADGSTSTSGASIMNFGNPPYANSSSVADANGYGAFEYAPPSGYYALCTKNLAEYG